MIDLHIGNAVDDKLKVTISGKADEVVAVLAKGLPEEDLRTIRDALTIELSRRSDCGADSPGRAE